MLYVCKHRGAYLICTYNVCLQTTDVHSTRRFLYVLFLIVYIYFNGLTDVRYETWTPLISMVVLYVGNTG